jgi:uncharacterized membrane protein
VGAIALTISILGIPLAIILVIAATLIVMLSGPVAGYYLGRMMLTKSKNPVDIMLLGAAVLIVLYYLPIIGFLAGLLGLWLGSGAILLSLKHRLHKPKYKIS